MDSGRRWIHDWTWLGSAFGHTKSDEQNFGRNLIGQLALEFHLVEFHLDARLYPLVVNILNVKTETWICRLSKQYNVGVKLTRYPKHTKSYLQSEVNRTNKRKAAQNELYPLLSNHHRFWKGNFSFVFFSLFLKSFNIDLMFLALALLLKRFTLSRKLIIIIHCHLQFLTSYLKPHKILFTIRG